MELLYLNEGWRRYGERPVPAYPRKRWAFQMVFDGATSVVIHEGGGPRVVPVEAGTLSLAGPDCQHGWGIAGEGGICRIVVFQFDAIAPPVDRVVGRDGFGLVPVGAEAVRLARALYRRCHNVGPEPEAGLVYRIAAHELSLMFLNALPPEARPLLRGDTASRKVAQALAWFESHLHHNPSVEAVAEAVATAPSHLRRLFHQAMSTTPREAFAQVRFERAHLLMRDASLSLEAVAEGAGFGSGSAFSRAYRLAYGRTPSVARKGYGS